MNVAQRDGENQAPDEHAEDARPAFPAPLRPAADYVIALVDRFEKRLEMGLGPESLRGRHEHQRQAGTLQGPVQRGPEAIVSDRNNASLDRPSAGGDQINQRRGDAVAVLARSCCGEHDDPDPGIRQRIAFEMFGKGVVARLIGRRHANSTSGRRSDPFRKFCM
jgi:hypothetical protein